MGNVGAIQVRGNHGIKQFSRSAASGFLMHSIVSLECKLDRCSILSKLRLKHYSLPEGIQPRDLPASLPLVQMDDNNEFV